MPEQHSSVDLEAEVERLRKRTHEIQEAADKRCALLSKTVEQWRSSLALADSYLEESGVVFHSSVTRAKAASLFQQIATLQAHLAAQTAVVEAIRGLVKRNAGSPMLPLMIRNALDAADVPVQVKP